MNQTWLNILAVIVPLLLLVSYVLMMRWALRRSRRARENWRQNPDTFPSRRSRVLRVLPFAALLVIADVAFVVAEKWEQAALSTIGVVCFAYVIYGICSGRGEAALFASKD